MSESDTFRVEDFMLFTAERGRRYARNYPDIGVDAADIAQEMNLLLCLKRDEFTARWAEWDNPPAIVKAFLDKRATEFCRTKRSYALVESAQYAYTPDMVRDLLDTFFNREDWVNARIPEDARSLKGHDGIEMSSDIARVWDRLSLTHARALFVRYALGEKPARDSTARKALNRAVDALTDMLNDYQANYDHEGPGARTVVTNAHALSSTGKEY